ncbi:MAG TPA: DUF4097 family beta strand repeat-containing protein [Acidobacteriota bacterium]|jgi:hypothetical protein
MKLTLKSGLFLSLLLAGACSWESAALEAMGWEGIDRTVNRTFQVRPGGKLTVESDLGSIQVKSTSSDRVDVEVIRKVNARDDAEADKILRDLDLQITQSGSDVQVRAKLPRHFGWDNWGRHLRLAFNINVPRSFNVDLQTSGGSIGVDDLQGEVRSKTSGGSLRFGHIQGPVHGRTSGGSIHLDSCNGNADVETSGGSIQMGDVEGDVRADTSGGSIRIARVQGTVKAETSGGSIDVEEVMGQIQASTSGGGVSASISRQPRGDCRLSTSGGSINVNLADRIAVDLDAETSGGHVRVDFPVTIQGAISKTELRTPLNGGGPKLFLRTSGGNVNVRRLGADK